MTALPRALAPWAKSLAIFPEPIAIALGGLASRLAGIVGSLGGEATGNGVLDGFDGLTRRGSYERLVVTEWLLQEELPEEFIRRAVAGEHVFMKRAYREPSTPLRSCVLFDAGPEQLGGPRIAQLAALIVFAERAMRHQVEWTWGILQDASQTLHDTVDPATVRELLRARCTRPASTPDLDRARALVPGPSELWLVGAPRLEAEAAARRAFSVAVSELLEPAGPQRVRARVCASGRAREMTLDLPPSRIGVRLLRDPFEAHAPRPAAPAQRAAPRMAIHARSNMLFSVDGRLLHLRGAGRSLVTFRIPNSPSSTVGEPIVFVPPGGEVVVAAGQSNNQHRFVVTQEGDGSGANGARTAVHRLSRRGATVRSTERFEPLAGSEPPPARPTQPLRPLGVLESGHFCFVDGAEALVELHAARLRRWPAPGRRPSKAVRGGLTYVDPVEIPPGDWTYRVMTARHDGQPGPITLPSNHVLFGTNGAYDFLAYPDEGRRGWVIVREKKSSFVPVASNDTAIGVIEYRSVQTGEPLRTAMVTLDEARTKITSWAEGFSKVLLETTFPILYAAASDAGSDVAYLTRDGELGIYSCRYQAMLFRTATELVP